MKIPQTTPNVGAYYGNEENGQWQPNGVMLDSGVGGGVVGSGDAGMHRPRVYPMHIPRGHVPAGYVMAGAYYPPAGYPGQVPAAPAPDDFADYMWMENEEEFDKQVMQQLEEEALMEQCIEAMLEDEQRERQHRPPNGHNAQYPTTSNGCGVSLEEAVSRSTLNPLAAEFVPTGVLRTKLHTEEKQEPPEPPVSEQPQKVAEVDTPATHSDTPDTTEHTSHTEEVTAAPTETPEVSAADITPLSEKPLDKRPPKEHKKETRAHPAKVETKKPVKSEVKPKAKPVVVKSETKVQPKKKEVKTVKSETKTEDRVDDVIVPIVELPKPAPTTPSEESAPSGFKPINYAAAAKANKPKKPSPPPADKITPPPTKTEKPKPVEKSEKKEKPKVEKPAVKSEKAPVQRKNSAK